MLYFLRFWKVFDGKVWFYAGFERFLMPNVVFPFVLKGFWWKSLVYQRFWKVWVPKRTRASKPLLFIMKTMPCDTYWSSRRPGGNQSFQTITFHYRNDALWDILKLKLQRRPPELLKHHFSLSNRCPVSHFGAQGAQKAARALKALLFVIKWMR